MMPDEIPVGAAEMARLLNLATETVKRRATLNEPKRGEFPGFKTKGETGHWRFYPSAVLAHIKSPPVDEFAQSNQSRGRRRKAA